MAHYASSLFEITWTDSTYLHRCLRKHIVNHTYKHTDIHEAGCHQYGSTSPPKIRKIYKVNDETRLTAEYFTFLIDAQHIVTNTPHNESLRQHFGSKFQRNLIRTEQRKDCFVKE